MSRKYTSGYIHIINSRIQPISSPHFSHRTVLWYVPENQAKKNVRGVRHRNWSGYSTYMRTALLSWCFVSAYMIFSCWQQHQCSGRYQWYVKCHRPMSIKCSIDSSRLLLGQLISILSIIIIILPKQLIQSVTSNCDTKPRPWDGEGRLFVSPMKARGWLAVSPIKARGWLQLVMWGWWKVYRLSDDFFPLYLSLSLSIWPGVESNFTGLGLRTF